MASVRVWRASSWLLTDHPGVVEVEQAIAHFNQLEGCALRAALVVDNRRCRHVPLIHDSPACV